MQIFYKNQSTYIDYYCGFSVARQPVAKPKNRAPAIAGAITYAACALASQDQSRSLLRRIISIAMAVRTTARYSGRWV